MIRIDLSFKRSGIMCRGTERDPETYQVIENNEHNTKEIRNSGKAGTEPILCHAFGADAGYPASVDFLEPAGVDRPALHDAGL
ncbi:hypothetical protein [Paracoccus sp. SCSIO 75233]|uniref:hypothetical protein n=1 Tax=Paracoccus sp. SCSIO 75233 TaxID=3017782 RepID=UPI0022F105BE|nr:hypothetical protein [Paracoccus sp. SCSIO 75233]WBU55367.1 hypothetical protein PAF12_18515 [Paracoccus sp. SCSIO 75233]